jgi:DNA-binding NtrC family response regulator
MSRLLIVEDDTVLRITLAHLFKCHDYQVVEVGSIADAKRELEAATFDVVIADLGLPDGSGMEIIPCADATPVLIIAGYASVRSAVEAMKLGAVDYIAKPVDDDELLRKIQHLLSRQLLLRKVEALKVDTSSHQLPGLVGSSPQMREVFRRVGKVAPTNATVLILGESGTGKELVARALHELSPRREAPVVAVNCAAIPENLIESELFGHEKGAFTGAVATRRGLIETADGGTLFLDEIGELPIAAQARLLRVLQEGEIRRVGSTQARRVDLRLIAATHRDLERLVTEGRFRPDLYFRLRVMEIWLPPLRARGKDIEALADFLLDKTCRRLNRATLSFSLEAKRAMREHSWPGNVRELENTIERAVILCEGGAITAELLALEMAGDARSIADDESLASYFRRFVLEHQGRLTETELARRLGISRKALWERRQRFGIPRPKDHPPK